MIEKDVNFFSKVYEIVKKIPHGKVTTYGAIAEKLGIRSSARMVGWALNSDKLNEEMPYHRVVNRNGELTGKRHFATVDLMKQLLESEGIEFSDDAVDMKNHFWKP
jgi:methylated-DNA-protein-cysteine methyltransferase-like protein